MYTTSCSARRRHCITFWPYPWSFWWPRHHSWLPVGPCFRAMCLVHASEKDDVMMMTTTTMTAITTEMMTILVMTKATTVSSFNEFDSRIWRPLQEWERSNRIWQMLGFLLVSIMLTNAAACQVKNECLIYGKQDSIKTGNIFLSMYEEKIQNREWRYQEIFLWNVIWRSFRSLKTLSPQFHIFLSFLFHKLICLFLFLLELEWLLSPIVYDGNYWQLLI